MSRAALLACALAVAAGCDLEGGGEIPLITDCGPEDQDPTFCCSPSSYDPIDPSVVRERPGTLVGRSIAIRGIADQFVSGAGTDVCRCSGEVCGCTTDLALRAHGCDDLAATVPLGGQYGNQEVACTTSCWPLSSGLPYTVCGAWIYDPISTSKMYYLEIHALCEG
jgi:hypothetical protein